MSVAPKVYKAAKLFICRGKGQTRVGGGHVIIPFIDFNKLNNYSACIWINEMDMSYFHGEAYFYYGTGGEGELSIGHFAEANNINAKRNLYFSKGMEGVMVPFDYGDINKFTHYCLTYSKNTLYAYRNGEKVGQIQAPTKISTNPGYAAIGRHWWSTYGSGTSTRFIGDIDDFRIYNRALSPEEIQQLYSGATQDTQPDPFRFSDQTRLNPNQTVTSNAITVAGIDTPAALSISNGAYAINGGSLTTQPGTVSAGDSVSIRLTTARQYATETSATLTIGGVSDTFSATTRSLDVTPDAFQFQSQDGATLQQVVVSAPVAMTGLEAAAPIRITNGDYAINGGPFTNQAGQVNNGDAVQVRLTAARDYHTPVTATLTVGDVQGSFTVTTQTALPPDTVPDVFTLDDRDGVAVNSIVVSNPVIISGINLPTPIGINGGFYAVNGGGYTNQPGTVQGGDSVQVRVFAAAQKATPVTAQLDVGGVSEAFIVTTEAPVVAASDTTPDPFKFSDQGGLDAGVTVTSNPVAITGINAATPVRISGGWYAINGGTYSSQPGTVKNGDVVQVQLKSGALGSTTTARLNVGGVEAAFNVTTRSASVSPLPAVTGSADWSKGVNQTASLQPSVSGGASYGRSLVRVGDQVWIAAPQATSGGQKSRGIVYRWQKQGDGVYQETGVPLSQGKAGDLFGTQVLAARDQVLVSAPGYDRDAIKNLGRVYVYDATTAQLQQTLEMPELYPASQFGLSLAVSGNWLAIGAPGVAKNDGRVYLYAFENNQWTLKQTLKAVGKAGYFGTGLALSDNWLMVGAPKALRSGGINVRSGLVYAYQRSGTQWKPAAANALPLPEEGQYRSGALGAALALRNETLAIAAPKVTLRNDQGRSLSDSGRVYTWSLDGVTQTWQIEATLEMDMPYLVNTGGLFGSTLNLSDDGRWLVIGAPGADQNLVLDGDNQFDIGRVFLYRVGGLGWSQTQMLKGEVRFLQLGRTVHLTPDELFIADGKGGVGVWRVE